MSTPLVGPGAPALDAARMEHLRKVAVPVSPATGIVTDYENGCVLVFARHPLAVEEVVIRVPLWLFMAAAANIEMHVVVPVLNQLAQPAKTPPTTA